MLTEQDQEEISRGVVAGLEGRVIAVRINRCPSVVSREIVRHGGGPGIGPDGWLLSVVAQGPQDRRGP